MNLLAFLWLVGCIAAVCIAFAVDDDVWRAIADRIRNPRPSVSERILDRYYAETPTYQSSTRAEDDDGDIGPETDA